MKARPSAAGSMMPPRLNREVCEVTTKALLEGGPFDGAYVLVPAGAHAVWVETLAPSPWVAVSPYPDESPGYVAKFVGSLPPLRVDECSRYVQYRRRANPGGIPTFFAPPEGMGWSEEIRTPYFAKPAEV
jgi:hypothetical protein